MTRHIDILFTSPPSIDFPQFVGAEDESGQPCTVGKWLGPGSDSPFWRFRLTAAELLMYLIADGQEHQATKRNFIHDNQQPAHIVERLDNLPGGLTPVLSPRAALRAKLAHAKPRTGPPPEPLADPLATEPCPACHAKFNPALDQFIPCSTCGEDKCTAKCFDSVADPCKDCKALAADPADEDDVAFQAPAKAEIRDPNIRAAVQADQQAAHSAIAGRLFDGVHHGKGGVDSEPADEDDE